MITEMGTYHSYDPAVEGDEKQPRRVVRKAAGHTAVTGPPAVRAQRADGLVSGLEGET